MDADRPAPAIVERDAFARRLGRAYMRLLPWSVQAALIVASLQFATTRDVAGQELGERAFWLAHLVVHWTLGALACGLAFAMLDMSDSSRRVPLRGYVLAIVAGSFVGAGLMTVHTVLLSRPGEPLRVSMAAADVMLYVGWILLFWSTLAALLHAGQRRIRRSERTMRAAERSRIESERRHAAARLAALRAQIEPEFLIATLARLESLYAKDPGAADRLLDALIVFLRRTLASLRRPTTSVAGECQLAADLLRVTEPSSERDAGTPRLEVDDDAANRVLPAAALVPVVQFAIAGAAEAWRASECVIRARAAPGATRIAITLPWRLDAAPAPACDLERGLQRLCGPAARVAITESNDGLRSVEIVIPVIVPEASENGYRAGGFRFA